MGKFTDKEMYLIDAKTMWDCPTCYYYYNNERCSNNVWCDAGESYRPAFDKLKRIDAKPVVHGRWIDAGMIKDNPVVKCSVCSMQFCDVINNHQYMYRVCPYCGSHMDEVE